MSSEQQIDLIHKLTSELLAAKRTLQATQEELKETQQLLGKSMVANAALMRQSMTNPIQVAGQASTEQPELDVLGILAHQNVPAREIPLPVRTVARSQRGVRFEQTPRRPLEPLSTRPLNTQVHLDVAPPVQPGPEETPSRCGPKPDLERFQDMLSRNGESLGGGQSDAKADPEEGSELTDGEESDHEDLEPDDEPQLDSHPDEPAYFVMNTPISNAPAPRTHPATWAGTCPPPRTRNERIIQPQHRADVFTDPLTPSNPAPSEVRRVRVTNGTPFPTSHTRRVDPSGQRLRVVGAQYARKARFSTGSEQLNL